MRYWESKVVPSILVVPPMHSTYAGPDVSAILASRLNPILDTPSRRARDYSSRASWMSGYIQSSPSAFRALCWGVGVGGGAAGCLVLEALKVPEHSIS